MTKKKLIRIIIFYTIAITLSNVFRFDLLNLRETIDNGPVWAMLFFSPFEAIGVLIGALLTIHLLKKSRHVEISIFGTSVRWSIIMSIIPIFLLTVIGVKSLNVDNTHYYGLLAGVSTFIYCFFEEIGWRGYLEEELKDFSNWKRIMVIASLWYLWHLPFLRNPDFIYNLKFFAWLIIGSWGIGTIVNITKSVFAATCFHMVINIIMFNGYVQQGLDFNEKAIILVASVFVWIIILIKWIREKNIENKILD